MPDKIYMLNALWFKADGGEDRYREYLKVVTPLISKVGGKRLRSLTTTRALVGEFDPDLIFFVEYPNWQAFKDFANSADYHKIAYLKEEALEKCLHIRCDRPEEPFH